MNSPPSHKQLLLLKFLMQGKFRESEREFIAAYPVELTHVRFGRALSEARRTRENAGAWGHAATRPYEQPVNRNASQGPPNFGGGEHLRVIL